ncbi:hypothetical protein Acr_00g0076650 [Actinidia rufa]|uniref:Uncharacterized protein n=1 Tax=Actinidia rufa TaxID=165716 RepID=A0A7J0DUV2_9ERIC|nr:hypothetical protein Acr_00g0076650 [Actinidia rufa]
MSSDEDTASLQFGIYFVVEAAVLPCAVSLSSLAQLQPLPAQPSPCLCRLFLSSLSSPCAALFLLCSKVSLHSPVATTHSTVLRNTHCLAQPPYTAVLPFTNTVQPRPMQSIPVQSFCSPSPYSMCYERVVEWEELSCLVSFFSALPRWKARCEFCSYFSFLTSSMCYERVAEWEELSCLVSFFSALPRCMPMPVMSPGSLMSLNLPWDSRLQIILDISRLDGRNWSKHVFEALQTQILNTSPLPSFYEAFAIVDGDERRHRLLTSISLPETFSTILDQTTFVILFSARPYCQYCHKPGHLIDCYFVLHPELKTQFNQNHIGGRVGGRSGGRATPRVSAIVKMEPLHVEIPNLNQLQTQIAQL